MRTNCTHNLLLASLIGWISVTTLLADQEATPSKARNPDARPNIVIILADDMGYSDLGLGGKSTIDGNHGDSLNSVAIGFTFGYHINDNIQFTAGYRSTVNDHDPTDLSMDTFLFSLVFGWHSAVEGMKRLSE